MTLLPRYAIYYAPSSDTPLWRFGSEVLGYDAATGQNLAGFSLPGYPVGDWDQLTQRPRIYGLHATMKAPFHLGAFDETGLRDSLAEFCKGRAVFRLGPLGVTAINDSKGGGFVALTPAKNAPELVRLEQDVVVEFDHFRRPLTVQERDKRHPESLSVRQIGNLDRYGYPFVLDDYRFHITLTGLAWDAASIADVLADEMANCIGTADIQIDALCLFKQEAAGQHFRIIERFDFGS